MEFVFTDIMALVILATVMIAFYFAGTYWKHRTLTNYAHWFEEELSSRARVKFASHGHAGLKVKCEIRDSGAALREMHFALSLGARENLMYYPFALITGESDSLTCWAILHRPIQSNLRIVKRSNRKAVTESENSPNLTPVETDRLQEAGYIMYATDRNYAIELLSRVSIPEKLKETEDVQFIEFDKLSSKLHITAKLRMQSLPQLVNLMFVLGKSA